VVTRNLRRPLDYQLDHIIEVPKGEINMSCRIPKDSEDHAHDRNTYDLPSGSFAGLISAFFIAAKKSSQGAAE